MKTTAPHKTSGHSADVRMELSVNGFVLPIAHLGPNFLVLETPIYHRRFTGGGRDDRSCKRCFGSCYIDEHEDLKATKPKK